MTTIDWNEQRIGPSDLELLDAAPESVGIDVAAVRRYRQGRVRGEMERRGIDAVMMSDAINIRYATGTRNMQIFSSRNAPSRYLLLTPSGRSSSSSPAANTSPTASTLSTRSAPP